MKRYYIATAVQDARGRWRPATLNIVSPSVRAGETIHVFAPNQNPVTGALVRNWYLVLADLRDHALLLADLNHTALPDVGLDVAWADIDPVTRTATKSDLMARGLTRAEVDVIDNQELYRGVLRAIAQKLQTVFSDRNLE